MLEVLHIENIAIIEEADIRFEAGFNALTGETGAGKSIVIDALSAVLGQRTSRELIRTGADKAFVSAVFSGVDSAIAEEQGVTPEEDGSLLLQREIHSDGKSVCRVGGRPVTVGQLKALGSRLLNIHGQHDGQQLLDEEQHLQFLDSFGKLESLINTYAEKYNSFTAIQRKIQSLQMDESEKARRVDTLTYQINELERAKLHAGEEEELAARRNLLRNAEKFTSAVAEADYALNGDDSGDGALGMLRRAQDAVGAVRHLDDDYADLYQRLEALYSEAYDVAATIEDKREGFDFSPNELDDVESRLDQLYRLKKKYGPSVEDMLAYLERCRAELEQIEYAGDALAQLERQLDMGRIRFAVDITEKPLSADGMDQVRFLMSANVGEELRPIHKIASGGELARIMLAMKNVLSEQDQVGTLVFDEVDTGVSGRAAQKVAEKMARISRRKQVLCVTHLPQLAAMADTHFSVEKGERDGRTYTAVQRLDREQRRQELARLTGGSHVSQTILDGAEELLAEAEKFRASMR